MLHIQKGNYNCYNKKCSKYYLIEIINMNSITISYSLFNSINYNLIYLILPTKIIL
jgi:hypothetical protein